MISDYSESLLKHLVDSEWHDLPSEKTQLIWICTKANWLETLPLVSCIEIRVMTDRNEIQKRSHLSLILIRLRQSRRKCRSLYRSFYPYIKYSYVKGRNVSLSVVTFDSSNSKFCEYLAMESFSPRGQSQLRDSRMARVSLVEDRLRPSSLSELMMRTPRPLSEVTEYDRRRGCTRATRWTWSR